MSAAQIRLMREYQGLTTDEMAEALHLAPRSYKRFENGQDPVPPGVLEDQLKLVQQFEDTIDGLLEQVESQTYEQRIHGGRVVVTGPPIAAVVYRGGYPEETIPPGQRRMMVAHLMRMCGVVPFFPEDRDPTYTILDIP